MGLLARVAKLVRADLAELAGRVEDPGNALQQIIVDIQNQLMQVKTRVAVSSAGLQQLRNKHMENCEKAAELLRILQSTVATKDGESAAIEHQQRSEQAASRMAEQIKNREMEVEQLKAALYSLSLKLEQACKMRDALGRKQVMKATATAEIPRVAVPERLSARQKQQEIERMLRDLKRQRKS